ncbi:MAG: hypothetical protein ACRDJV_05180 [Actinomycetota bacterium]
MRWEGEDTYRVLSYYFSFRWNSPPVGEFVRHVLEPFAVPPDPGEERNPPMPGLPPRYSLLTLSKSATRRHRLFYGTELALASDEPRDVLEHLFWHINYETVRMTGSFLLIHAGAVASPAGDGILLPADSGSGKSTLVTGLVQAGFGYLSDEAGAIDPVSRRLYPYRKAIFLKENGAAESDLFADLRSSNDGYASLTRQWCLRPEDIRPGALGAPCEVRFVIAPRYRKGAATEIAPMTRADAVRELAMNSMNLPLYQGRALPLLADIVRGAQSYRLTSGDLGEAVRAVEGLVRRPPVAS